VPNAAPSQQESVLPPSLGALLEALEVLERRQVITRGYSRECGEDLHDFQRWLTGLYRPPVPAHVAAAFRATAPPALALVLDRCRNCETVEVRDRTFDRIAEGQRLVASGRRDGLLGWYSGARRNQRTYFGSSKGATGA
jgi:hypothetical protein